HKAGELSPFQPPEYQPVTGDLEEPRAYLEWQYGEDSFYLRIFHRHGAFSIVLVNPEGSLPTEVKLKFAAGARFTEDVGGHMHRRVDRTDIEAAVDEIVATVRQLVASD